MSPRAAWRLEALGFTEVYDYVDGQVDWAAAGLPTEGKSAGRTKAIDVARTDAPTCRPDEVLGRVRERVERSDIDCCVVTNDEGIVFGVLSPERLAGADDVRAGDVMRPGPSTFRPNVPIEEMATYMTEHDLAAAPITSSDGRFLGLLRRDDAVRETGS